MKLYPQVLWLFLAGLNAAWGQGRIDRIIDDHWKFTRENPPGAEAPAYPARHWESISLPHTWNARDGQDGGNDYYRGIGFYRKELRLDDTYRGKSIFLRFEGAATVASVYVNGSLAGTHRGNFGAFCFDVTSLVRFDGPNVIAVRLSNARDTTVAPLRGDFTIFGGIYRSVHLLVLENLSISPLDYASPGVYARQLRVSKDSAEISVTTILRNGGPDKEAVVRCTILDAAGRVVREERSTQRVVRGSRQEVTLPLILRAPRLWNGAKDPYLYTLAVEILDGGRVCDRLEQPLGLRFYHVDPDRGFFLNGRPYRLYGVNRHQDRENMGWAIGRKQHEEDYQLIRELGCNAVRLAHYQHAEQFYDLCDRGGTVVWAELALVDDIGRNPEFVSNCRDQLTELIKQNFNHPSIIFWSIFNELIPDDDRPMYGRVVAELNAAAKGLDPSRLSAMASRSKYGGDEQINTLSDVLGYNVYRGWYEGKPEDFASFADTMHSRFPLRPLGITEYGAGAGVGQHEVPPQKPPTKGPWHPEEWQSYLHEVTWKAMAEREYLWGTFVWNMFDFASDGRAEGERHGINDKGLVSYNRVVKKDAFFFYKANWNPEPMVYVASRRFSVRPAGLTEVRVYANTGAVELFVNGHSRGEQKLDGTVFVWKDIPIVAGRNVVRAVGRAADRLLEDVVEWTGTVKADGKPE